MSQLVVLKKLTVPLVLDKAIPISTGQLFTPYFELWVKTTNNGATFIGDETVDSSWIPRSAGTVLSFGGSNNGGFAVGDFFNLSKIFLDTATTGNEVVVQYFAVGDL